MEVCDGPLICVMFSRRLVCSMSCVPPVTNINYKKVWNIELVVGRLLVRRTGMIKRSAHIDNSGDREYMHTRNKPACVKFEALQCELGLHLETSHQIQQHIK